MSAKHTTEELQADDLALLTVTDIDELSYLVRKYSHETGVHVSSCETHEDAVRTVAGLLRVIRAREQQRALHSPMYSTRAAMREAGVPNCEMGGGVSTADAIRSLAAERDSVLLACRRWWMIGTVLLLVDIVLVAWIVELLR